MFKGERAVDATETILIPSYDESIRRLQEEGLLIPGLPGQIVQSFLGRIEEQRLSPQEIALKWAQARESQAGNPRGLGGALEKFMIGLHGTDVIRTLIPEKRLGNQVIDSLSWAYREVAKQA